MRYAESLGCKWKGKDATPIQLEPVPAAAQRAIVALQRGDKERARALLEEALLDHPDDPRLWMWLSWAAETEEERRNCLLHLQALDPTNRAAKHWLAGQRDLSQQASSIALQQMLERSMVGEPVDDEIGTLSWQMVVAWITIFVTIVLVTIIAVIIWL